MAPEIFNQKYKLLAISSILLLGMLIYSNTLRSSFHFDDSFFVINNSAIRDITNLKAIWNYIPTRFIVFLTLALNYHFHQFNVFGYHLLNLVVHLSSAILVWWLGMLIFSTSVMKKDYLFKNFKWVALFAALIFLTHPLQTESVTYIWQRCASLVGLLYLFSVCLYIQSRLLRIQNYSLPKWGVVYILSLFFALMSMFTKENSITLPAMIILCEVCFFEPDKFSNWRYTIPFLFLLPIILSVLSVPQPGSINTGWQYFLTQPKVIITYIRLLFIPLNQNLIYDYPVVNSLNNLSFLISFAFLFVILIIAIRIFYKYRLVSFAILWFFLTLLPESSFVPLDNVIFEHRLYLPMVGFSFFLVSIIYYFFENKRLKPMVTILLIIISCYAILAYRRNFIWKDELTLWNDVVHKSPNKAAPYTNRGNAYYRQGNFAQAIFDYTQAAAIFPGYTTAYYNRGNTYYRQGNFAQAISDYTRATVIDPSYAEAYLNRGFAYYLEKEYDKAWIDVHKIERLGYAVHPDFLNALKKASGRNK
ncbi:MAG: tetratricopeptide repeat protein [Candidatus Omnitrophica bacterium]|nr:tetratricopeptide repeat protein [Candidatus Omnitrophota bacterium]